MNVSRTILIHLGIYKRETLTHFLLILFLCEHWSSKIIYIYQINSYHIASAFFNNMSSGEKVICWGFRTFWVGLNCLSVNLLRLKNILDRKAMTQQRVDCTYYKTLNFILKITEALSILNYNVIEKGNRTIRKTTAVIFLKKQITVTTCISR